MSSLTWKDRLKDSIDPQIGAEVDAFEMQMVLRKQGKVDEKLFAETRLRRGIYGQRYDNGQRNDGLTTQKLAFPTDLTKGPTTCWDAPGMVRIKIPYGGLTPVQLEVMADLAEEYSDGILHVTTRQDIQLHYVHIENTPNLMRRLGGVGITTREACGNSVRNVTGCPLAGVCRDETFDITPYAKACAQFLLGHRDAQDFGRKMKIAFSGCAQHACGLAMMHDIGAVAKVKSVNGVETRGFEFYVGGGLGPVPYQAQLLTDFLPVEELLPVSQAICRVFGRLGEKKNRNAARMKFLVHKLGLPEFKRLVEEERKILPPDPAWVEIVRELEPMHETPLKPAQKLNGATLPAGFAAWRKTNVYAQRQEGYSAVTLALPLGDFTADQSRAIADLVRKYVGDSIRLTVDQNIMLRWVADADLPALYTELAAHGLARPGANTIVDVTSCPGTDTCKLGISSSRGLAAELSQRLAARAASLDESLQGLHIKVSGCFNSCGQHHVADIGFYGASRKKGNYTVPHFQMILGGQWENNAGSYGLAVLALPSKRVPEAVDRVTEMYLTQREKTESFQAFVKRTGKAKIRAALEDLAQVPAHEIDPSFYSDWGDPREFTIGDMGVGECAGEVISPIDFGMAEAERLVFEAQLAHDAGELPKSAELAFKAMVTAANALVRLQFVDVPTDAASTVREFRTRFYDTQLFFDPFAGGRFAQPLFHHHETPLTTFTPDAVRRLVEEAQLFIDASHGCLGRLANASPFKV
ncbi:MAG: nitrite/sulfite reductase [Planctomycetota bacterium]